MNYTKCQQCGKQFTKSQISHKQKCCSFKCAAERATINFKENKRCEQCGKIITKQQQRNGNKKFCSRECYLEAKKNKEKKECIIKNCTEKHAAKGYCLRHYGKLRRRGNPLAPDKVICKVEYNRFCCCGKRLKREQDKYCSKECYDKNQALNYEIVKQFFESKGCILLTNKYKNSRQVLEFVCSCGNTYKKTFPCFKKSSRCRLCSNKIQSEKRGLNHEFVKQVFEKHDCKLLTGKKKINNTTKLKYRCNHGHEAKVNYATFRLYPGCKICRKKTRDEGYRHSFQDVKKNFGKNDYILLSKSYINVHHKLDFICPRGHMGQIGYHEFVKGRRCSVCAVESRKGEGNPSWNPNLTQEEREIARNYPEYKVWRKAVYERDNYACQICGSKKNICAHHLNGYAEFPKQRTEVSNGVTLCRYYHNNFHSFYGKINNTKEQFYEFKKQQSVGGKCKSTEKNLEKTLS